MRISEAIEIDCPPAAVQAFTADPLNDPRWITDLAAVRWLDGGEGTGARAAFIPRIVGRAYRLVATLETATAHAVTWRADTRLLRGRLDYRYEPLLEGTRFSIVFTATLPLLLRPLDRPLAALLRWRLRTSLRTLERILAAGG